MALKLYNKAKMQRFSLKGIIKLINTLDYGYYDGAIQTRLNFRGRQIAEVSIIPPIRCFPLPI